MVRCDRGLNEAGPATPIMARSVHRSTARPDTLAQTVPSIRVGAVVRRGRTIHFLRSPGQPAGSRSPSASCRAAARVRESADGLPGGHSPERRPRSWRRPPWRRLRSVASTVAPRWGWMSSSRETSARVFSPFSDCCTTPRLNSTVKTRRPSDNAERSFVRQLLQMAGSGALP